MVGLPGAAGLAGGLIEGFKAGRSFKLQKQQIEAQQAFQERQIQLQERQQGLQSIQFGVKIINDPNSTSKQRKFMISQLSAQGNFSEETRGFLQEFATSADERDRRLAAEGAALLAGNPQLLKAFEAAAPAQKTNLIQKFTESLVSAEAEAQAPLSRKEQADIGLAERRAATGERAATIQESRLSIGFSTLQESIRSNRANEQIKREKNAATIKQAEAKLKAAGAPKFSDISTTRNQFLGQSKDFKKIRASFKGILETVAQPPSAIGDIALVFGFMKMLDPGSTVREGEAATVRNAAGIPDRLRNQYNSILEGVNLNPQQRLDIEKQARLRFAEADQTQSSLEEQFTGLARRHNIDPSDVVIDFRKGVSAGMGVEGAAAAQDIPIDLDINEATSILQDALGGLQ